MARRGRHRDIFEELKDEFLTCSICQDIYTDPATLQCGHTYCRECLSDFIKTQSDSVRDKIIPCPMRCEGTKVPKPSEPVDKWSKQIKAQFFINGLMEKYKSKPELPAKSEKTQRKDTTANAENTKQTDVMKIAENTKQTAVMTVAGEHCDDRKLVEHGPEHSTCNGLYRLYVDDMPCIVPILNTCTCTYGQRRGYGGRQRRRPQPECAMVYVPAFIVIRGEIHVRDILIFLGFCLYLLVYFREDLLYFFAMFRR